jgi:hypothetical protein
LEKSLQKNDMPAYALSADRGLLMRWSRSRPRLCGLAGSRDRHCAKPANQSRGQPPEFLSSRNWPTPIMHTE